jgi:DnaJ family protein C protein 3
LSSGRHNLALDDFDHILRLNPSFVQAHYQKAKILAKEGDFDRAGEELRLFQKSKREADADDLAGAVKNAAAESVSARAAAKSKNWDGCLEHATNSLEVGPNSIEMRELRVECALEKGNIMAVHGDLRCVVCFQCGFEGTVY